MSGLMSGSRYERSASSYVEPKVRQGKEKEVWEQFNAALCLH